LMVLIGIATGLMASAIMNMNYYIKYRNLSDIPSLKIWAAIGGVIGIIGGIVSIKGSLQRERRSALPAIVRFITIVLIVTGIVITVWYYYVVDYFQLKDDGPLALLVGLIFGIWSLLFQTSKSDSQRSSL
jgi:hypothetical protein